MFIIETIPLTNLPPQVPQLLSYYFGKELVRGSVVEILIGNRKTAAVVIGSASLEAEKASLKKSFFQLKKISGVLSEDCLVSDAQFKIALWLSQNYFAPLGLCLKTVLPPFFLKKNYEVKVTDRLKSNLQPAIPKPLVLLSGAKSMFKNIEREIKKTLDLKKQVLVVVPEISTAKYFYDLFAGYHEVASIHSKVPQKQLYKNWLNISSGQAEVIIGTRQSLFSPFKDLGLIIIEDPANESYKSDMSPKYNTFDLAFKMAGIYSSPLVMVSQIPDIKERFAIGKGDYLLRKESGPKEADIKIVDMVQEMRAGNFSVFSASLKNQILEYVGNKKKILILSSRKGYFGALVCENCGFSFKCPNCSIPLKPHKLSESILLCHRCSAVQKPPQACPNCHSYKFKTVGFPGSQRLEEELSSILKNAGIKREIFLLDSGAVKTARQEEEMLKKMENTEGYICIATQMIFSHRFSNSFDLIAIPNIDSLTTIPDFRSEEQLFYQLAKIKDFEPEKIVIQTFVYDSPLLGMLKEGNYAEFYDRELSLRKIFWYPPFAKLIKLSYKNASSQKASYEARLVSEKLKTVIIQKKLSESVRIMDPSPAFVEKEKGLYVHNIIIKILPDQKMDDILRYVPSQWFVDVDPRNIL